MKISRRKLNILIERFLLEKNEIGMDEIPFTTSGADDIRPGASLEGAVLDRGDGWGFYKIENGNYFYVKQKDYKGKNTNWKKLNKRGKEALDKSITDGDINIKEKSSSGQEKPKKEKLDNMPSGINVGKKEELKKKVKNGLSNFLSVYLSKLNEKYSLSKNAIKALTNGEEEITSKNVIYSKRNAKTILNPFVGAENPVPPRVKTAHTEMLKQISLLLSKQINDLRVEQNIIKTYFKDLGLDDEGTIARITVMALSRIESAAKSVELGDVGKGYSFELFYKNDVKDLFFKPEDIK